MAIIRSRRLFIVSLPDSGTTPVAVFTVPAGYRAIMRHLTSAYSGAPAAGQVLYFYAYVTPAGGQRTIVHVHDYGKTWTGAAEEYHWGSDWNCMLVMHAGDTFWLQNRVTVQVDFQASGHLLPE